MIIRMKKRDVAIVSISLIFILSIIFSMSVPLIYALAANASQVSVAWLVISNRGPDNITLINSTGFSVDPIAGGVSLMIIVFNASDPDGAGDINGTLGGRVTVNITLGVPGGGNQFRTETNCTNSTDTKSSKDVVTFNCTISMQFYDNASSNWVINITVEDQAGATARNDSSNEITSPTPHTFTYNFVDSYSVTSRISHPGGEGASINFTSLNPGTNNNIAKAPLLFNNSGNSDFDAINITGADLIGTDSTTVIDISNFRVNATNSSTIPGEEGSGMPLTVEGQTIPVTAQLGSDTYDNLTLLHGPGLLVDETIPYGGATISRGNQTLLFWVDVPSGISTQTYNTTWNLTAINIED